MRALILDGPGDLGRATAAELGAAGVEAVLAGRDPGRYEQMLDLRGDLSDLYRAAAQATVVVNFSGVPDVRLAERAGAANAAFVETGSDAGYLSELAGLHPRTPVLTGGRLLPVLAGMLARDVAAHDSADPAVPVEIGIVLGAGDPESAADLGATYALFGRSFTDPATGEAVLNFSGRREFTLPDGRRRHLAQVDWPDQQVLTAALGRPVRTYLATGDRFSTTLLRGVKRVPGAARLPSALHLPGRPGWQVVAQAGPAPGAVRSWAAGRYQTPCAAHILTIATRRAPTLEPGLHRVGDLLTLSDLSGLEGLALGRSALGVPQS
ncbi:hypothetical protein Kisp01_63070 [Kineosporia sp. NBRC 101677]|uniref:hypothetical protein n=1 Tax=Kineosporia sp. NBRC 101677 TaxID=3032197 RepID=UPI0024A4F5E5|nr:hypothetical protein [Kineosporia sp. NBRC 101677]GLY19293.1 hypothetical protein Kisp01_63070 [Kineosporia sp. NBRC 101677]